MIIYLEHSQIEFAEWGALVRFEDGQTVEATPRHTPHYHVISHRLGYGDNVLRYCQEHEFAHLFVEEKIHNRPSRVLWALAHGEQLSGGDSAYEEMAAQTFQRWLRAHERPIGIGVQWDQLKAEAFALLGD